MKKVNVVNMQIVEKDYPESGKSQGGQHHDVLLLWGCNGWIFKGKACRQLSFPTEGECEWRREESQVSRGKVSGLEGLENQSFTGDWRQTVKRPSGARLWRILITSQRVSLLFGQELESSQSFWVREEHNYSNALRRLSGQQGSEYII